MNTNTAWLLKIKPFNCVWCFFSFTLSTLRDNKWIYETRACSVCSSHLTKLRSETRDMEGAAVVHIWFLRRGVSRFSPLPPHITLNWFRKQFIWKKYLLTICFKQTAAGRSPISSGMQVFWNIKGRETEIENWSHCSHAGWKTDFLAAILNNSFFLSPPTPYIHSHFTPLILSFVKQEQRLSPSLSSPSLLINILLPNRAFAPSFFL